MASSSFRSRGNDVEGRQSSLSVQGETMGRQTPSDHMKRSYRYRVVAHDSSVDETLFGSHRDRNKNQIDPTDSPPKKYAPQVRKTSPAIKPQLSAMPKTRNKYRIVKHTPTYVDQSLFGGPLHEPSFEAPWTDKKAEKRRSAPLSWAPPVEGSLDFDARSGSALGERPLTSSGGRPRSAGGSRPGSAGGHRRSSTGSRPGSASGRRSATPSKPAPWK